MAYYAFLDVNNIVTEIIVGKDEGDDGIDWEQWYGDFRGQPCKRTSYNTKGGNHLEGGVPFRKNFAGIGYVYDPVRDAFIPPQPAGNYVLDDDTCLWKHAPELGILGGVSPIIAADGIDFVTVYVVGATPNSTQEITVNAEPFSINIGVDGYGEFELSSDASGLLLVEWGEFSLEVAAL
jgi:hypothetical protein